MSHTIDPNPANASLVDLRTVQKATADRDMANRTMAIIMLLNGIDRQQVVDCFGCHPNSLRNWVVAFNASGIEGLATAPRSGRPPRLSPAQRRVAQDLFAQPEELGEAFWTKRKFHGFLKRELQVDLGYSTLARYLREDGFRQLVPRPTAPDRDSEDRGEFRELLDFLADRQPDQLWFCDEAGFMADPRPKAVYAKRGTTPTCPATGLHIRENVIGAVQPLTGEFVCLVFDRVDTPVFQYFLDYLASKTEGREVLLVLDNASWHKTAVLNWHHLNALYLPPWSPDLNPIERLWGWIKDKHFTNWYSKTKVELQNRLTNALLELMDDPERVQSVCAV